jgi:hypothetical protein
MDETRRRNTVRIRWRGVLLVGAVIGALVLGGCSTSEDPVPGTGDAGTGEASVTTATETTRARETTTTAAPETTAAAAETTAAAAEGSGSETSGESTDTSTSNDALWVLIIVGGVLIIGLIVWFASRSGARRGAAEQARQDAYGGTEGEAPPPPPADGPPG